MITILVVEDNEQNMKLAQQILQDNGYTVLKAYTAEDGLKIATEQKPDLILMDIELPGMNGIEAIRHLRDSRITEKIKIIALTALAMQGDQARILAAGANAYLSKPYSYKDLLGNIQLALEASMSR